MNFKPGDKAIYVGAGIAENDGALTPFRPNDEVTLGETIPTEEVLLHGGDPWLQWFDVDGFGISEEVLRKPDAYDITAQEWYQRILRGDKLEETV